MNLDLSSLAMPIRLRPETPMSDEELMWFSRENRPLRMEREPNGEILIMTPAGTNTAFLNLRIARALGDWADEDGRGLVCESNAGFTLPNGAVRSPDAAWVSRKSWNALTKAEQRSYAPLCPEFVVELTSPSDRASDVKRKVVEEWTANGAQLAWLVEADARRVTIYRPGQEAEVLEDPTSVQGTGCVAGFELVMEPVWGSDCREPKIHRLPARQRPFTLWMGDLASQVRGRENPVSGWKRRQRMVRVWVTSAAS